MGFGIKSVWGGVSVSVSDGELETPARFPLPAFRLCKRCRLLFDLAPNLS